MKPSTRSQIRAYTVPCAMALACCVVYVLAVRLASLKAWEDVRALAVIALIGAYLTIILPLLLIRARKAQRLSGQPRNWLPTTLGALACLGLSAALAEWVADRPVAMTAEQFLVIERNAESYASWQVKGKVTFVKAAHGYDYYRVSGHLSRMTAKVPTAALAQLREEREVRLLPSGDELSRTILESGLLTNPTLTTGQGPSGNINFGAPVDPAKVISLPPETVAPEARK